MPDAAAIGSKEVNADEVNDRRVGSAADAILDPGDSDTDAWRSSSAICGVNYTGIGELDWRTGRGVSY